MSNKETRELVERLIKALPFADVSITYDEIGEDYILKAKYKKFGMKRVYCERLDLGTVYGLKPVNLKEVEMKIVARVFEDLYA